MEKGANTNMTWREMKNSSEVRLRELKEEFSNILASKYKETVIDDGKEIRRCFELPDGSICHPFIMIGDNFNNLAIEYSEDIERMKVYDTEDGDLYPPDDFESKEALFKAMLTEVEG